MACAVIAFDGPDPSRRAAARDRHIASITAMARDGVLLLGLPLHGARRGSLMILAREDSASYLAREPFATEGVWQDIACRPVAVPALPWRPWPAADAPMPAGRGHTILLVSGPAGPSRFAAMVAAGAMIFAAETTDAPGAILVTTHADDAAAHGWAAADPLLRHAAVTLHPTLFRPLPYPPLPVAG